MKFLSFQSKMKGAYYIILTVAICALMLFKSCYTLEGHVGVSQNEEESKKRDVFVCSVKSFHFEGVNDIISDDKFESGWVERKWHYGSNLNETLLDTLNAYQIILEFKDDSCLSNYSVEWYAGLSGDHYLRIASKNSLMGDLDSLKEADHWVVQKQMNLSQESPKEIIGSIYVEY